MKNPLLTGREGIPRDAEKLPAFQSLADVRALFEDDEVVLMVNHYLRLDWRKEARERKLRHLEAKRKYREEQEKLAAAAKPATVANLRPGVPLRQQIKGVKR